MTKPTLLAAVLVLLAAQTAGADLWDDLARYEYGDPSNAGQAVEKALQDTPVAEYGRLETGLIRVVTDPKATQTGKAIACRMLQQVGTERCIPAVAPLLTDPILSHYARLVLQRLESPKADQAMREALPRVPARLQVGILGSLGERRDRLAVPLAADLARSRDAAVAAAAIQALGKIGGPDAAEALLALHPAPGLGPVHLRAMARCAASLPPVQAVALCEKVLAGSYRPARVAALKVLATADPAKAAPRLAEAIRGDDRILRDGALVVVAETRGEVLTRAMTDLLKTLPAGRQASLVLALGSRGDRTALEAVLPLLRAEAPAVRRAALKAVARLGDARTVRPLLALARSPEERATVAKVLVQMTAEGIGQAVVDALADPALRRAAIEAAVARGCAAAVPPLLDLARTGDAETQKAAWTAVAALAGAEHIEPLMKALVAAKGAEQRAAAEDALRKVLARVEEKEACFQTLARYFEAAAEPTQTTILALGAVSGDPAALALERKALASGKPRLAQAALRALAAWPNASAADDLLRLAKTAPSEADRLMALRGYIRIAGLETADLKPAQRVAMLKTALGLASRPEEKKLAIAALQRAPTPKALDLLKEAMAEPALRAEAEMAAAALTWDLRKKYPEKVADLARQLAASPNKTVAGKARRTLAELAKGRAFVRAWLVSPVYRLKGGSGAAVHKAVFPPEKGDPSVTWTRLRKGVGKDVVDLEQGVGRHTQCCVYAKTTLVAPAEQDVLLAFGSDDGIKVWLNGRLIHDLWTTRGHTPAQDVVKAHLKAGPNVLLVKITNEGTHWAFSCQVTRPDGLPVEGLKVQAK